MTSIDRVFEDDSCRQLGYRLVDKNDIFFQIALICTALIR